MTEVPPDTSAATTVRLDCYALKPDAPQIVPAPVQRAWMDDFIDRHAYRCLPMAIANSYGWEIQSPCNFIVEWDGTPKREALRFFTRDDYPQLNRFAETNFGRGIATFHTGYIFRTPPGWDLMVSGPLNRPKRNIVALSGVVETDWLPYPFTMNWQMIARGAASFQKGEPFCMIYPVPHGMLQAVKPVLHSIDDDPDLKRQMTVWAHSRAEFLKKEAELGGGDMRADWQKFYFKGEMPEAGVKAPDTHINKLRLAEPIDERK
jgi:hypothetical protein